MLIMKPTALSRGRQDDGESGHGRGGDFRFQISDLGFEIGLESIFDSIDRGHFNITAIIEEALAEGGDAT